MMLSNKIINYLFVFTYLLLSFGCTKTEPSAFQKESFIKTFGGAYLNQAVDMIEVNGNYYVLGNMSEEDDNTLIYLAKTDDFGNRVWAKDKTYTIDGKQTKAGQIIKLTEQNGFAIIGAIETDNDSLYFDTYFLIIDENGEVLVENTIENESVNDYGKCIAELENGGFLISTLSIPTSGSSSYINLITASSTGSFIQASSRKASEIFQICKTANNKDFYISAFSTKPIVIIYNTEHKNVSLQEFGNIKGQIRGITQDKTGNTFICGMLNSGSKGGNDGFIAQLVDVEKTFEYEWLIEFGNSKTDYLEHLIITENNEILVTGSLENTNRDSYDIWVLKTDITGNFLSETLIGGSNNEYGVRIIEAEESRYIVEATTSFEKSSMISIFKSELK